MGGNGIIDDFRRVAQSSGSLSFGWRMVAGKPASLACESGGFRLRRRAQASRQRIRLSAVGTALPGERTIGHPEQRVGEDHQQRWPSSPAKSACAGTATCACNAGRRCRGRATRRRASSSWAKGRGRRRTSWAGPSSAPPGSSWMRCWPISGWRGMTSSSATSPGAARPKS